MNRKIVTRSEHIFMIFFKSALIIGVGVGIFNLFNGEYNQFEQDDFGFSNLFYPIMLFDNFLRGWFYFFEPVIIITLIIGICGVIYLILNYFLNKKA